jgi:hypothetical protein
MNPDPEIDPACRARPSTRIITQEFAECLSDHPDCDYRLVHDDVVYCFHPARHQIIAQTPAS